MAWEATKQPIIGSGGGVEGGGGGGGGGGGAKAPYLSPSSATLETKYKIQNLKILLTLQIRLTLQY